MGGEPFKISNGNLLVLFAMTSLEPFHMTTPGNFLFFADKLYNDDSAFYKINPNRRYAILLYKCVLFCLTLNTQEEIRFLSSGIPMLTFI